MSFVFTGCCSGFARDVATGGYMGIYPPPPKKKSVQVNFYGVKMTSERLLNMSIKFYTSPQNFIPLQNKFLATLLGFASTDKTKHNFSICMPLFLILTISLLFTVKHEKSNQIAMHISLLYSVSQKIPPEDLWQFFQNGWKFFNQILHAYSYLR